MIRLKQNRFSEIEYRSFNLVVAASGFESRASYQMSRYKGVAQKKIILSFNDKTDNDIRKINDDFFERSGFIKYSVDGDLNTFSIIEEIIFSVIKANEQSSEINIYVDYSSMTRNLYAQIIYIIKSIESLKTINIVFGYSHAKYTKSLDDEILNRFVEPLFGFCSLSIPIKPTALIICLGNEKNRVYGLQEYFDATTYLFYSDSSFNNKFSKEVEVVNSEILSATKPERIIKFPMHDMSHTNYLLENICKVLSNDFRVIIAPCGPKTFTLLALITSIRFDLGIEVWRISPGKGLPIIEREASGEMTFLEVTFNH